MEDLRGFFRHIRDTIEFVQNLLNNLCLSSSAR